MNDSLYSSRILSHGKITDLTGGFSLPDNLPFSVYVRKKANTLDTDVIMKCRCILDSEESDLPVPLNDWTPAEIVKISANALSIADYDIYWGSAEKVD